MAKFNPCLPSNPHPIQCKCKNALNIRVIILGDLVEEKVNILECLDKLSCGSTKLP